MVDYNKIKLGSWQEFFKPFYDSGGFDKIYKELRERSDRGINVIPKGRALFRAFELCDMNKLTAIIATQDPYFMVKDGVIVADGLAYSCSNTKVEQPSLKMIYDAIEEDVYNGLELNMARNPNLSFLSDQGILLLNTALTVEEGVTNSMRGTWRPFMEFFFKGVQNEELPIVFMGAKAREYQYLCPDSPSKYVEHPANAARKERKFEHENMFTWIDKQTGKKINWGDLPFDR